jgi:hypothetical protein
MSANAQSRRQVIAGTLAAPLAAAVTAIAPATAALARPERKAMEAYASWLFYERRLLCLELYPDQPRAEAFVMGGNAGFGWHFPAGQSWKDMPQPSSRAAAVLDQVGVDWRGHPDRDFFDYRDSGFRPDRPASWPHVDARLIEAAARVAASEAAIEDLHKWFGDDADSREDYQEISEERADALDVLVETPARSFDGIQAKAATLKRRQVEEDPGATGAIAASLADDVLKLTGRTAQA